mmetsp:Transcript_19618/g.42893  ORF Transcript_19618/g.42893 Transcript_19618/m.42893 type:complete len:222 (+) Transcript_19618:77-742(+)
MVLVPRSAPSHTMGAKLAGQAHLSDTPGPGYYDSRKVPPLFRSGAAVFGTSARQGKTSGGPGPGSYAPRYRSKGPHFSCSPRRGQSAWRCDTEELKNGPGPGAYDLIQEWHENHGPKYTIAFKSSGSAKAEAEKKQRLPKSLVSPEAPLSSRRASSGPGFGTSVREPGRIGPTPGPGQYGQASTLGGPCHSMAPRRPRAELKVLTDVPGPGAHNHHPIFGD